MTTATETIRTEELEHFPAEQLLVWAADAFQSRIAFASSFGAEDVVIIDMLSRVAPAVRVFTLDTGRLPAETYAVMEAVRARYGLALDVLFPRTEAVEAMARERGVNLFYRSVEDRKRCCQVRKVEPLGRALTGLDAWITGLRRDQAGSRAAVRKVEADSGQPGRVKVNPLADWTWEQVWAYVREHDVPHNGLHAQGYPSIGCAPCTRAVAPGRISARAAGGGRTPPRTRSAGSTWRTPVDALVDLPFALPTAVAGLALTAVFSGSGWVGRYLEPLGVKAIFSPLGVTIALVFIGLLFVVRTVQPVLEDLETELEEAAASLGAGRWQTVWRVILPTILPAVLTGFALAFGRAIGEYGSVIFIAGNLPMKTEITPLLIITKLEQYDYAGATGIAVVMLVVSFGLLLAINGLQWWSRRYQEA